MRRASCHASPNSFFVNTATETFPDHPDLSLETGESRQSDLKPETLDDQPLWRAVDCKRRNPNTNSSFRQVGLARVHVEILLLSEEYRRSGCDHGTTDDSTGETDSEESESDNGGSGAQSSNSSHETEPTTTAAAIDNTAQVQTSPSANQSVSPLRRSRVQREDESGGDDDDNRQRKRPRQEPPDDDPPEPKQRFACPYQAHEPWRGCFKPASRNDSGGCDNISRLKEHLKRKHMSSYRCPRCWKYFNTRNKAQAHPESNCAKKAMPSVERFMSLDQEQEVNNCGGMQPEDTWWQLFQLLIPGMDAEELPLLRALYYPYYLGTSLSLPSLNLSGIVFGDTPTQSLNRTNGNETAPVSLTSPSDAFSGPGNTPMTSQSFSVPLLGTTSPLPPPIPSTEGSVTNMTSLSAAPQSHELGSTTPGDTLNTSSTPASSHTMAPSSTSDASQMQQNHDRLKKRVSRADAENRELRKTISSARDLLEEFLETHKLEGRAYERLSRVADVLEMK